MRVARRAVCGGPRRGPASVGWPAALALALAVVAAGCGGDATSSPEDASVEAGGDTKPDPTDVVDASGPDVTPDVADVGADVEGDLGPYVPTEGELGWPCQTEGDCNSSYCVDAPSGKVCSKGCTTSCPGDFACRQDLSALPDVLYLCLPRFPTLCDPCTQNTDCTTKHDSTPHRCVAAGDDGAFCGGACDKAGCPAGYFCATVADVTGAVSEQCVPETGTCACSPKATALGLGTTCHHTNAAGSCPGERRCAPDDPTGALTACDAAEPSPDLCDGVDNDCDGAVDEGFASEPCAIDNAHGSCPGVTACGGEGGVTCEGVAPAAEVCNGKDDDCDGETDEDGSGCVDHYLDEDGDGWGVGEPVCLCGPEGALTATKGGDCNDAAKKANPGGFEVCNGLDDDCDGETDEPGATGCFGYFADVDGDGYGDAAVSACLCAPAGVMTAKDKTDCDDAEPKANPGSVELCDGLDNDCDGQTDEEGAGKCVLYFEDGDGDGFGDKQAFACLCAPAGAYVVTVGGDCDDGDAERNPQLPEVCDGVDNDCDGLVDEPGAVGCAPAYRDEDGDGFGLSGDLQCVCEGAAPYTAAQGGDCNDLSADAKPGGVEACNGLDDDCDGFIDEEGATGCTEYLADLDQDGFAVGGQTRCLCAPALPFTVAVADAAALDCDDKNPLVHPDAAEVCNQIDDDCDGEADEAVDLACSPFYRDADGDGWGVTGDSQCLCKPEGPYVAVKGGDCDDGDKDVHPLAEEQCDDVDRNCNGDPGDVGAVGCALWFRDGDGDGFGVQADYQCLCGAAAPWTTQQGGDCNDDEAGAWPGAAEVCNGLDDDCDGATDEAGAQGCTDYFRDTDGDGFGVASDVRCLCAPAPPYVATVGGDCDDLAPQISPGAEEVCDGLDNDCNGVADDPDIEGCTVYYRDTDGDTFGRTDEAQCLCAPKGTFTATQGGDCDDLQAAFNPKATEQCNGQDDDCDGAVDEADAVGCYPYMLDQDGDTFGVAGDTRCLCAPGDGYGAFIGGDCDDLVAAVNPGAAEACNGVDDDCDGLTDPEGAGGCVEYLVDGDGDGYGVTGSGQCLCALAPPYQVGVGGDCDDEDAQRHPGVAEVCNGVDDDCDGFVDETDAAGCATYFLDGDGDGFGVAGASLCLCSPLAAYTAAEAGDCDDANPARNPDEVEACNGVDDDCDGQTDGVGVEGCVTLYEDVDGDTWGDDGSALCLCASEGDHTASRGGDCDDDAAAVRPDASETCNAIDDDCDGVVDEGCGLSTTGWPTYLFDARRIGHSMLVSAPTSSGSGLRWKKTLVAGAELEGSPVILDDGSIVALAGSKLFRLQASDGATLYERDLPAPAFKRASPSVRAGGTMLVPAGRELLMVRPDLSTIWSTPLPGAADDVIVASPLVDAVGHTYVVTNAALHRVGPDGVVAWSTPVPNSKTKHAELALGPSGRVYFAAADHKVYAVDKSGAVLWTFAVSGQSAGGSVVVSQTGTLYQTFGSTLYAINDAGAQAVQVATVGTGSTNHSNLAIHNTGFQCCNPQDFVFVSPQGGTGLRRFTSALGTSWTASVSKPSAPGASPVFDTNGDVYVGAGNSRFHAFTQSGSTLWTFTTGAAVDGAAAIGPGYVVFGDDAGTLYCID